MKGLLLLSGGIDSPVAGMLLLKNGFELDLLHMDNRPFADDAGYEKVLKLAKIIASHSSSEVKLLVAPHGTTAQASIAEKCGRHVQCVLCRRFMYRAAGAIAKAGGYDFLATGENLGQVASQTLDNLHAENEAVGVPILRPLIGWDKVEIVDTAREFGTYEASIEPSLCCLLAPKKPAISAKLERIKEEEGKLDVVGIVKEAVEKTEHIVL